MQPLIGITCGQERDGYFVTYYYAQAVQAAGGMPVLLPFLEREEDLEYYHRLLDGLILSGGGDVDPIYFGEEPVPELGEICPERDRFELGLAKLFLTAPKPVLAICRGMQVLNIAAGGTLCQHLEVKPGLVKHRQHAPKWYPTHDIEISPGSKLFDLLGGCQTIRVNSFHHQAIGKVAPGFKVNAWAKDGVIEGLERENGDFCLGVQWHPECMWEKDQSQLELFKALVAASQRGNLYAR